MDKIAEGFDEMVGLPGGYDGLDNDIDIGLLVVVISRFMKKFFDDVGKLLREVFSYLGTSIFGRYPSADGYQLVECGLVIVIDVLVLLFDVF